MFVHTFCSLQIISLFKIPNSCQFRRASYDASKLAGIWKVQFPPVERGPRGLRAFRRRGAGKKLPEEGKKVKRAAKKIVEMWLATLHLHDVRQVFKVLATGALLRKCEQIGKRAPHFVGLGGASVMAEAASPEFLGHLEAVYGESARVFTPNIPCNGWATLPEHVQNDPELCESLQAFHAETGALLTSYISHQATIDLGHRLGIPVLGVPEPVVRAGVVALVSNKIWMCDRFEALGLKVPDGISVYTVHGLLQEAQRRLDSEGRVFLRQAQGDGGLGNVGTTREEMEEHGWRSVEDWLAEVLLTREDIPTLDEWTRPGVLVERYHQFASHPAALCHIDHAGHVEILQIHDQFVASDGSCVGILRHPDWLEVVSPGIHLAMVEAAKSVGAFLASVGLRNTFFSLDGAVEENGHLLFTEVNPRMTAAVPGLAMTARLGLSTEVEGNQPWLAGDPKARFVLTHDQVKVGHDLSIETFLAWLKGECLLWDDGAREGVICTLEPGHGSMGAGLVYADLDQLRSVYAKIDAFAHASVAAEQTRAAA